MPRRKADPLDRALDAYTALDAENRRAFMKIVERATFIVAPGLPERKRQMPKALRKIAVDEANLTAGEKAG